MAAPAIADRRRPAAGTIPGILNAAAPFELKLEGVEDAAEPVDEEALEITADDAAEIGIVVVGEKVAAVCDELLPQSTNVHGLVTRTHMEEALAVVDAAVLEAAEAEEAVPMENVPLVERT